MPKILNMGKVGAMTFKKLHRGAEFTCTDGLTENTEFVFARRILSNAPTISDFLSYHELGSANYPPRNEAEACKHRGVSITTILRELSSEEEVQKAVKTLAHSQSKAFANTVKFKPTLKNSHLCAFLFLEGSGVVEETPSKRNKAQCTLYKSDTFSLKSVKVCSTSRIL